MRKVIGCAILQDNQLVVVRKEKNGKSSWILPGGKPNEGEGNLECLSRELGEELPFLKVTGQFKYYWTFQGISPNQGDIIENIVYTYEAEGELDLRVSDNPNENVKEARCLRYPELSKLEISNTTMQVVQSLKNDSYL